MRLMPMYAVYRCHNCNWRGWLPRSTYSPGTTRLMIGLYILIVVLILAGIAFAIIRYWPSAKYKY